MRYSELKKKEVVCAKDLRKIGYISDLEIDECKGILHKLYVRESLSFCNFWRWKDEIVIPYHKICKIGPDIVMVDLC